MKKKIFGLVAILLSVFCITGCGSKSKLDEIVEKFNSREVIKSYADMGVGVKATTNGNNIEITYTQESVDPVVLSYTLDGDMLSGNFSATDDKIMYASIASVYLIDTIGMTNGYEEGDMLQSLNDENVLNYTLEKEGLFVSIGDELFEIKVDITKKVPLIDFSNTFITVEDLEDAADYVKSGSYNASRGNVYLLTSTYENESEITIIERKGLTSNSYNTLLSVAEVLFGTEKAPKYIKKNYSGIEEGSKNFKGVKIVVNYEPEEDELTEFADEDVKIMKVIINLKTFKKNMK